MNIIFIVREMYFWCFLAWCLAPHHEIHRKINNNKKPNKNKSKRETKTSSPHARLLTKHTRFLQVNFIDELVKKTHSNRSKQCLIIGSFSNGPGHYCGGISRFWCVTINYARYVWPNFWSMARLREHSEMNVFLKVVKPFCSDSIFSWKIMMLNSDHVYFWDFSTQTYSSSILCDVCFLLQCIVFANCLTCTRAVRMQHLFDEIFAFQFLFLSLFRKCFTANEHLEHVHGSRWNEFSHTKRRLFDASTYLPT